MGLGFSGCRFSGFRGLGDEEFRGLGSWTGMKLKPAIGRIDGLGFEMPESRETTEHREN